MAERATPAEENDDFQALASRGLIDWLAEQKVSLAVSSYQTGKLLLIGRNGDRLSIFQRNFERCLGLWTDTQTLWLAAAWQLWRLENAIEAGEDEKGYDRLYIPRVGYTTGDIDVHDVAADGEGRPIFVSTLFSCLATVDDRCNFRPLWRPPFVSRLAAEDRCHLNGLAMEQGRPRYVTAGGRSDVFDGWRDCRQAGGVVIDVASGEVAAEGLSMPHSPRLYRGKLWLLDSGSGWFGYLDSSSHRFERVTFCPGYARGLAFVGDYALVGVSRPRHEPTFNGLPLDEELAKHGAPARCGLQVIDLRTGDVVHWLRLEGSIAELYDVVALPGVIRPKALGFQSTEIRHNVWIDDEGRRIRWTGRPK